MSFHCPDCSTKSLAIVLRLELEPDSCWDEITLQTLACNRCGLTGLAVYQESRRGALDAEIVHHNGYRVGGADFKRVERAIKHCPAPGERHCGCFAHRVFGGKDSSGRWNGLDGVAHEGIFSLER